MEYRLPLFLRLKFGWLSGLLLLCVALPAQSGTNPSASDGDLALLPPYCQDANWDGRVMNTERRAVWRARLGQSFQGLHHYCWGLIKVKRAFQQASKAQRSSLLNSAVGEYQYAISNSAADFVLLPEMFYRMGEAYLGDDNIDAALQSFESSRTRKPDYWPPYLKTAEIYERVKLRARALDILREGLRHSPAQAVLLERYKALGGKLPIEPAPPSTTPDTAPDPASNPHS